MALFQDAAVVASSVYVVAFIGRADAGERTKSASTRWCKEKGRVVVMPYMLARVFPMGVWRWVVAWKVELPFDACIVCVAP